MQTASHSVPLVGLSPNTTYHYRVRSTDAFGNTAVSDDYTLTTADAPQCPCALLADRDAPQGTDFNDGKPIEVGIQFTAEADGFINAIRFYKAPSSVGPFVGNLWTADGQLLASAPFEDNRTSGWQQVNLPRPVAVKAGVSYVASTYSHGRRLQRLA